MARSLIATARKLERKLEAKKKKAQKKASVIALKKKIETLRNQLRK